MVCLWQTQAHMRLLLEPSYANLEFELASALHCIISSYWRRMQACTSPSAAGFRPEVQVLYNSFNFHLSLCNI
jgi:hypothetical protein